MKLEGNMISGQLDEQTNEFALQQVKHILTETILNQNQQETLIQYLNKHEGDEDGQVLTLYDQLLVRLSKEEVSQFIEDLKMIRSFY
ncbi:hypothetical protein [Evansella halocellulosilytica]|uniref:hypothetical protein n=1 Tax=Evansella halocellulosilytica TaxID=2011013 RepID=UPI000BB74AC0|nr:hypothetical protein [Evansella halocellulosilytica]